MSYIDNEYAERMMMTFQQFKKVSTNPFKLNGRCVVCGDSAKDAHKARFWVFYSKKFDTLICHCFNCGFTQKFSSFLKHHDPELYREYILELRKSKFTPVHEKPSPLSESKPQNKDIKEIKFSTRLDKLPSDHPALKYVRLRKIPVRAYDRLYYTSQWQHLCNTIREVYKNPSKEHRLVIPIWDTNGILQGFQGRSFTKNSKRRYITIKVDDDSSKVFGVETIDSSKVVMITEGPIDSLFLDNAISITGGSLSLAEVPFAHNRIWVLDNEPRSVDTIERMNKLIDSGETVCFWDKAPWQNKDINDMVVIGGANPLDIIQYIKDNSFRGLKAKLRMKQFRKI